MAANYIIQPDPAAVWGLIWAMISAAVFGIYHVGKFLIKHKRARAMMAAGLDLRPAESDNRSQEKITLEAAILQFLRHQQAREEADRHERTRQWERIEQSLRLANEHSQALLGVIQAVNNAAAVNEMSHKHQGEHIAEVKSGLAKLSEWLRDNLRNYPPPRGAHHG